MDLEIKKEVTALVAVGMEGGKTKKEEQRVLLISTDGVRATLGVGKGHKETMVVPAADVTGFDCLAAVRKAENAVVEAVQDQRIGKQVKARVPHFDSKGIPTGEVDTVELRIEAILPNDSFRGTTLGAKPVTMVLPLAAIVTAEEPPAGGGKPPDNEAARIAVLEFDPTLNTSQGQQDLLDADQYPDKAVLKLASLVGYVPPPGAKPDEIRQEVALKVEKLLPLRDSI